MEEETEDGNKDGGGEGGDGVAGAGAGTVGAGGGNCAGGGGRGGAGGGGEPRRDSEVSIMADVSCVCECVCAVHFIVL